MGKAMGKAIEAYLDSRSKRVSEHTLRMNRSVLGRMAAAWDVTNRSPRSLDGAWLEDWLSGLDITSGALGVYEAQVRGFCKWAERRNILTPGQWTWDSMGGPTVRTRPFLWLPPKFFLEVIEAQESFYFRGLIATLTFTLGRGTELRDCRLANLRLDDNLIYWPRTKTRDFNDYLPVSLELGEELRRYLTEYRARHPEMADSWYLFPAYKNYFGLSDELLPTRRRYDLAKTVKRLIEPHIDPALLADNPELLKGEGGHTIRRSMARNLYESMRDQGVNDPLAIVQSMLGHKTRAMTERYIGLDSGRQTRNAAIGGRSFFGAPAAVDVPVVELSAHRERRVADGS